MEREEDTLDVIELGVASLETRGDEGPPFEGGGRLPITGLSDD